MILVSGTSIISSLFAFGELKYVALIGSLLLTLPLLYVVRYYFRIFPNNTVSRKYRSVVIEIEIGDENVRINAENIDTGDVDDIIKRFEEKYISSQGFNKKNIKIAIEN